jgi:hypothetical protein
MVIASTDVTHDSRNLITYLLEVSFVSRHKNVRGGAVLRNGANRAAEPDSSDPVCERRPASLVVKKWDRLAKKVNINQATDIVFKKTAASKQLR